MTAATTVTVRLPQALAEHTHGRREVPVPVGSADTLGVVLAGLAATAPGVGRRVQDETGAIRRHVNVYVGDDECRSLEGLATLVPPGTVVHVIAAVSGG